MPLVKYVGSMGKVTKAYRIFKSKERKR